MSNLAAIQAQLVDIRNVGSLKSLKLTLHVPEEHALKAIEAFGWPTGANPVPVALARLNLEKEVVCPDRQESISETRPDPAADKSPGRAERRPFDSLPLPQQAGILCQEGGFRAFLNEEFNYACETADDAADAVRERCNIASRSELGTNKKAAERFVSLREQYQAWRMVAV
jgi:hypothetical protein